jgi:ubiquinone/menaquinone biosynthesis C-methylase UbiE
MDPPRRPSLPPPATIRDYYDEHVRALGGDYIAQRWQGGEVQRRHYRQTRAALDALLAGAPLGDVLEVGCGPAVWTELLVGRAARVELLDISSEMLAQARRRVAAWDQGRFAALVTYRHGDFLTTAVAPASFDTLLSLRALEYVSDKPEFLARCFAVLRTGGRLLLGTKNDDWYDAARARRRAGHQRRSFAAAMQSDLVSARVLGEMVARAGFQDVAVLPLVVGSYHRPFRWRLGLATCDRLHRGLRGRPVQPWWSALVESVIAVARRRL